MSMENSIDISRNRTSDLPICATAVLSGRWKGNVKWILRICNERAWTWFMWLETEKLAKTCEGCNEILGFVKCKGIFDDLGK